MNHQFDVTGMTCGHCEKAVKQAITRLDPAAKVEIDREHNQVTVDSNLSHAQLAQAISEEGYSVA